MRRRLIDVIPLMQNGWHLVQTGESNRFLASKSLADVPTVDAVMLSDLEAWLYEIAINNVGEKYDGDFSDAVEDIINRLDGLRVFAAERRTDG